MRFLKTVHFFAIIFCLSSCSWLTTRKSLFGDEKAESGEQVSKEQYDQLLRKYDALMKEKKMAMMRQKKADQRKEPYDPFNLAQSEPEQAKEQLVSDVVNQLANVSEDAPKLSNSVSMKKEAISTKPVISGDYNPAMVEEHMSKIRKAERLFNQNKLDASLTLIKELEASPVPQIAVRAKFLLGEVLFKQGEFDLAMQVYEEVLTQYAYSGLVIKTLGRLIVCSEKLKQSTKQEKYYSILHDFFEEGA